MPLWVWIVIGIVTVFVILEARRFSRYKADKQGAQVMAELMPELQEMRGWIERLLPDGEAPLYLREEAIESLTDVRSQVEFAHTEQLNYVGQTYTDLWLQYCDLALEMWRGAPYSSDQEKMDWFRLKERLGALDRKGDEILAVPMGKLDAYARKTQGSRVYP